MGYLFVLAGAFDYANKAVGIADFMTFWTNSVPAGVWITIALIIPVAFNLLNVRKNGDIEFGLTMTKITLLVILMVVGAFLATGASPGPYLLGTDSSFRPVDCALNDPNKGDCLPMPGFNCTIHSKPSDIDWRQSPWKSFLADGATGRLWAFWECTCGAMYSFTGSEILGMVAAESSRQRETLPRAARRVSRRLIVYYLGAIIALSLNVSSLDPILSTTLSTDPSRPYQGGFILMLKRANVHGLPHIVNVVMIVASIGVANGEIFFVVRLISMPSNSIRVGRWKHWLVRDTVQDFCRSEAAGPGGFHTGQY